MSKGDVCRMSRFSKRSDPLTTLEEAVMLAVQAQPRYGLEISNMIYDASNTLVEMNIGTLYPLLKRLTQRGLLTCVDGSQAPKIRKGHKRKYYQLTPVGEKALDDAEELRQNLRSQNGGDFSSGLQPSTAG